MNPNQRTQEPPAGRQLPSTQSSSSAAKTTSTSSSNKGHATESIWSSLGRLKRELRRMEHQLDDASEADTNTHTNPGGAGTTVHIGSHPALAGTTNGLESDSGRLAITRKVGPWTGERAIAAALDGDSPPTHATTHHHNALPASSASRSSSTTSTHRHHHRRQQERATHPHHGPPSSRPYRDDSPKRVDFSRTNQLREVNLDGTYHDSLACPPDLLPSNNNRSKKGGAALPISSSSDDTLTNSRHIRETDLHFLNFSTQLGLGNRGRHLGSSTASASNSERASLRNKYKDNIAVNHNHHKYGEDIHQFSGIGNHPSPYAPPPSLAGDSPVNYNLRLPLSGSSSNSSVLPSSSEEPSPPFHPHSTGSSSSPPYLNPDYPPHHHHHHPHPHPSTKNSADVRWISPAQSGYSYKGQSQPQHKSGGSSGSQHIKLTKVKINTVPSSTSSGGGGGGGSSNSAAHHLPSSSSAKTVSSSSSPPPPPPARLGPSSSSSLSSYPPSSSSIQRVDAWDNAYHQRHPTMNSLGRGDIMSLGNDDTAAPLSNDRRASERVREEDGGGSGSGETPDRKEEFNNQLRHQPRQRPRPMKKSITAELKDNEIMMKLKERLKLQRSLVSSSMSGSNDTSLAESTSSSQCKAPPALPPREPLTTSANSNAPPLPVKTRKVAAAHPSPSYKGFTDLTKESSSKANNTGSHHSKKKSSGKKPFAIQLKKYESEGSKPDTSSRHPPPPPPPPEREHSKPKKPPSRIVAASSVGETNKKPSKPGAKNIITTSSWRAGQELILRELGATKASSSSKDATKAAAAHPHPHHHHHHQQQQHDIDGDNDNRPAGRRPDGAEAGSAGSTTGNGDVPANALDDDAAAKGVIRKSKNLYEDARIMLSELRMDPDQPPGGSGIVRSSKSRPAVKRKAPKAMQECEKQQTSLEKQRHYDPDSVRKYMQRQKTERLKRQQQEREAHQKAHERKEQMMKELTIKQKKTAKVATTSVRSKAKLSCNNNNKENKPDSKMSHDEDAAMTEDDDDDDESDDDDDDDDDDSTLQITPRSDPQKDATTSKGRKRSQEEEHRGHHHHSNHHHHHHHHHPSHHHHHNRHDLHPDSATASKTATSSSSHQHQHLVTENTTATMTNNQHQHPPSAKYLRFQGHNTNIDINTAVNDFALILQRHQGNSDPHLPGSGNSLSPRPVYPLGAESRGGILSNGTLTLTQQQHRTNQDRKQALAATAMSLSNRIAEETKKLEAITDVKDSKGNGYQTSHNKPSNADFVSRYDHIAGGLDDYAVFGREELPGVNAAQASQERREEAASRIQAAYRGHNVRQSLSWELPSGVSLRHRMRGGPTGRANGSRDDSVMNGEGSEEEEHSPLTDTSTFSEITATEDSGGLTGNKKAHHPHHKKDSSTRQAMDGGMPTSKYVPASNSHAWSGRPLADPYNVMSVMARQNKLYKLAGAKDGDTKRPRKISAPGPLNEEQSSAFVASLDLTSLKQPVVTSEERVVIGQTWSGNPVIARARYTRVEATVEDEGEEKASLSGKDDDGDLESDVKQSEGHYTDDEDEDLSNQQSVESVPQQPPHNHSAAVSRISDDDSARVNVATKAGVSVGGGSGDGGGLYRRQVSDAGLETDVSQLSDDEPKASRSKLSAPEAVAGHGNGRVHSGAGGGGRLSPNSLANKMSASLNYYESVEESLRHLTGMERTRAVALAQQESVSLAHVLKARQQEHSTEMRNLQLHAQQEAMEAQKQLEQTRKGRGFSAAALLEKEDNRRPDSRSNALTSIMSRSSGVTSGVKDLPGNRRIHRSSATTSLASVTRRSEFTSSRTPRSSGTSVSVKTAEDSGAGGHDSDNSIQTASDVGDGADSSKMVEEDIEESYSMSFDESVTDEESFRQVLPSESHRKEVVRRQNSEGVVNGTEVSGQMTPYTDLSSLFVGENSFNRFTADMVRQVMREEEYRAQHQAALLNLREKALREKAKAELAWLHQMKQQPRDKGADDHFPSLDKKEKIIRRNLQEQQAEIRRLKEANKMATKERQLLLKQHEEIAKIQDNTKETRQKLMGPAAPTATNNTDVLPRTRKGARPSYRHSDDEFDEASELSESLKDYKSDSEVGKDNAATGRKSVIRSNQKTDKLDKLRLDQKYMTTRQQRLEERKKRAKELLEWKRRLDEEESKVFHMENAALQAWGGGGRKEGGGGSRKQQTTQQQQEHGKGEKGESSLKKRKQDQHAFKKAAKPVPLSKKDDSAVVSDRLLSSLQDETAAKSRTEPGSISEAISTELSATGTLTKSATTDKRSKSASDRKAGASGTDGKDRSRQRSSNASGSESSIPEEVPTGSSGDKQKAHDSSDDTLINSSANDNDDYTDTFEQPDRSSSLPAHRNKTSVGKLLPQGNSPLPSPWSRKTGSESESEDSISHTETMSDASDYEVRIRQLSDELRRRRKEVEILKKERSKRQKDKLKAQEEALKKQLDAYNNYIHQLKSDKDVLEHDASASNRSTVRPQIKQPRGGGLAKASSSPSPSKHRKLSDDFASNSSSFEDMRDGTDSNQTSPSVDGKDIKLLVDEKGKKTTTSVSLMDRISEGSESLSDKSSGSGGKVKATSGRPDPSGSRRSKLDDVSERTTSSSVQEAIEKESHMDSLPSDKTASAAMLKINTGNARNRNDSETWKDDEGSYSMDFSENLSTLAQSHNRGPGKSSASFVHDSKGRSEADISEHIEDASAASSAHSYSISNQLKLDLMPKSAGGYSQASLMSPPTTGIQESDSETEYRINSVSAKSEGSSRPSSEKSVGSIFSVEDAEDEEEDIASYSSDKVSAKHSAPKLLPSVPGAASATLSRTDEDISEHMSGSLPSISDKKQRSSSLRQDSQDMLDSLLGYEEEEGDGGDDDDEEDEDEKTPVPTPREMAMLEEEGEEENLSLLATDPLADFHLDDKVLVWGRRPGVLRFKGKVDFSPGIWAGVELDGEEGDSDGVHENKRYFTCQPGHGVMVHGSDISSLDEKVRNDDDDDYRPARETIRRDSRSLDESLTSDQEEDNLADGSMEGVDASMVHSTPLSSPYAASGASHLDKPTATPVKGDDVSAMADYITDQLSTSLVQDSVDAIGKIIGRKSSPEASSPLSSTVPNHSPSSDIKPSSVLALTNNDSDLSVEHSSSNMADRTADGVMTSLLNEAISHMVAIKRRKEGLTDGHSGDHDSPVAVRRKDISHVPSSLDKQSSQISALESFKRGQDEDSSDEGDDKMKDVDYGMSLDPVQRPGSPLPGDGIASAEDSKQLDEDMNNLFGEYIDDDLGFDASPSPGKPQHSFSGDQTGQSPETSGLMEEIVPIVPHTRDQIAPIIHQAVDIFWQQRRYGESLAESLLEAPHAFLNEDNEEDGGQDGTDTLTFQSRQSWRRMLFDLTGEVVRDIYMDEDKADPPAWQKAKHKTQKYVKGTFPPSTVDALRHLVEGAVLGVLDLDGSRRQNHTVNKWNVRKKKDAVDAVLVQELGEEERGWVDYNFDELNLKISLTDAIFDSLIADTARTLNGIYQHRSHVQ